MKDLRVTPKAKILKATETKRADLINKLSLNAKSNTAQRISDQFAPTVDKCIQSVIELITETSLEGKYIVKLPKIPNNYITQVLNWLKSNKYIYVRTIRPETIVVCWMGKKYKTKYLANATVEEFGKDIFNSIKVVVREDEQLSNLTKYTWMDLNQQDNDFFKKLGQKGMLI